MTCNPSNVFYTLTMNENTLKLTAILIEQFPSKEGKKYWIKALQASDTVKGRLYVYFKLV